MSKKKKRKKSDKNHAIQTIILITATLQLIEIILEIVKIFIE